MTSNYSDHVDPGNSVILNAELAEAKKKMDKMI
jgi:hypothetical protein